MLGFHNPLTFRKCQTGTVMMMVKFGQDKQYEEKVIQYVTYNQLLKVKESLNRLPFFFIWLFSIF